MRTFVCEADGGEATVPLERWHWTAIYADGTRLAQFDERDGRFHRFGEIDLGRLAVLVLQAAFDPARRFELRLRPGMRPIHFYRNQVLDAGTPTERRVRLYCFGYQETVNGRNVKTILQIHPEGTVTVRAGEE